ncbi:MAG TPA: PAS domain S-box protein [Anaeromyxobacteraceae bacterium]|nr:PAS domain S-box protein [Anaeromyxobacteraceae bacterium]
MALTTTPETLHEIALLHARIQQLERLCGIREPGGTPADATASVTPGGLHELVAGFVDEMLVICDIAGTILYVNHACGRVLGYRPGEMIGTNAWGYVHPEDLKAVAAARSAPLDDGIPFENRARARDGSYRWVEFTARRWPQESPTHVVLQFRRAMHREPDAEPEAAFAHSPLQTQLRYAAALARLSQLALGLPQMADVLDAAVSLGASGLALEVGAWLKPAGDGLQLECECGLGAGARGLRVALAPTIAGLAFSRCVPTDETQLAPEHRAADPLLSASGAVSALAVPVRGKDRVHGALFFGARTARAFEPADVHFAETIGNVVATALDSRIAREALGTRERLTRALFDNAREGLFIVDDEGRVVDANGSAHALLGVPAGALLGRRPSEVARTTLDLATHGETRTRRGVATVESSEGRRRLEFDLVPRVLPGLAFAAVTASAS